MFVQYIIIRKDLNMSSGKLAAQVSHASMGAILGPKVNGKVILLDHPYVQEWLNGSFTKLVVYVKSKQKLLNIIEKLDIDKIHHKLIWDSCRTELVPEEENGTTLTCVGLIPLSKNKTPKYLGTLRLL